MSIPTEFHSERTYFLQDWHFSTVARKALLLVTTATSPGNLFLVLETIRKKFQDEF